MAKESNIPPHINEGLNFFNPFKFPRVDIKTLMGLSQQNLELIITTQQIAMEITQSLMELQQQFMKQISEHALKLNSILAKSGEKFNESVQEHLKYSPLLSKKRTTE